MIEKTPVMTPVRDRSASPKDGRDKLEPNEKPPSNPQMRDAQFGVGKEGSAAQQKTPISEIVGNVFKNEGLAMGLDPTCSDCASYLYAVLQLPGTGAGRLPADKPGQSADAPASPEAPSRNVARPEHTKGTEREGNPEKKKEVAEPVKEIDGKPSGDAAISQYTRTLVEAGFKSGEAAYIAAKTYGRFEKLDKEKHLEGGTPAEVLAGISQATDDIVHANGTYFDGNGDRRLADGQIDHLSDAKRKDMAKDLAFRNLAPDDLETQGHHLTCGLESCHKQHEEGLRVGDLSRWEADLVNTGKTVIHERNADGTLGKARQVCVDATSFIPDSESMEQGNLGSKGEYSLNYHYFSGARGMAGQVADALHGQVVADLKAERQDGVSSAGGIDKATFVYLANSTGHTSSGEGLYEQVESADGQRSLKLLDNNPATGGWDLAALNKATGGVDGAVFCNAGLLKLPEDDKSGHPIEHDKRNRPVIDPVTGRTNHWDQWDPNLKLTAFTDIADAHDRMTDFQNRTGQSGVMFVDAPFLPGGGEDGHGGHAINAHANADGTWNILNNWGHSSNFTGVSAFAMDKASNPEMWNVLGGGDRPGISGDMVPGSGTNSNEKREDANKREQEKEAEEARRAREAQVAAEQAAAQLQAQQKQVAQYRHQIALNVWASEAAEAQRLGKPIPPQPELAAFSV